MGNKCDGCFFNSELLDKSGSYKVCKRMLWDIDEAREECLKPGPCEMYLSIEKACEIIEMFNSIPNY